MATLNPGRTLTIFAVGFLALDGVLMILAGLWGESAGLVVWGAVFLAAAAGTVWLYKRHMKFLDTLRDSNREMVKEIEEIRKLINDRETGSR